MSIVSANLLSWNPSTRLTPKKVRTPASSLPNLSTTSVPFGALQLC